MWAYRAPLAMRPLLSSLVSFILGDRNALRPFTGLAQARVPPKSRGWITHTLRSMSTLADCTPDWCKHWLGWQGLDFVPSRHFWSENARAPSCWELRCTRRAPYQKVDKTPWRRLRRRTQGGFAALGTKSISFVIWDRSSPVLTRVELVHSLGEVLRQACIRASPTRASIGLWLLELAAGDFDPLPMVFPSPQRQASLRQASLQQL